MRSVLRRNGLVCLALLVVYFAVPVQTDGGMSLAMRIAVCALALLALLYALKRQLMRQLERSGAPLGGLTVGIVAGVLLFALADYVIAVYLPDQFIQLETRIDALYFALATLFTIGFGDVAAQGQVARGLLIVQMLFNALVIATLGSFIARQIGARARTRNRGAHPAEKSDTS